MLFIFALAGVFTIELVYGEGSGEGGAEWVLGVILLYLMWLLIAAMAKLAPKVEKPVEQKKEVEAGL
jgi:hypothetical protein